MFFFLTISSALFDRNDIIDQDQNKSPSTDKIKTLADKNTNRLELDTSVTAKLLLIDNFMFDVSNL